MTNRELAERLYDTSVAEHKLFMAVLTRRYAEAAEKARTGEHVASNYAYRLARIDQYEDILRRLVPETFF